MSALNYASLYVWGKRFRKIIAHFTLVHWRVKSLDSFSPCQDVGKKDRSMLTSAPLFSDHLSRTPSQDHRYVSPKSIESSAVPQQKNYPKHRRFRFRDGNTVTVSDSPSRFVTVLC